MQFTFFLHGLLLLILQSRLGSNAEEDEEYSKRDPHRDPSLCEVCKYLTTELKGRLDETGKTHEVIETGYGLDTKKKKKKYAKSELRLIEAVNDPHVCEKILEYNIHAERKGSLRFAKGRSQTMEALHNLVHKGVKVELGIPYDMWDTPSSGVTEMQRKCFKIVEEYEEDIEDWYWNHQQVDLTNFLCRDRVLHRTDQACLAEQWTGEKKESEDDEKAPEKATKKKTKKETDEANLKVMLNVYPISDFRTILGHFVVQTTNIPVHFYNFVEDLSPSLSHRIHKFTLSSSYIIVVYISGLQPFSSPRTGQRLIISPRPAEMGRGLIIYSLDSKYKGNSLIFLSGPVQFDPWTGTGGCGPLVYIIYLWAHTYSTEYSACNIFNKSLTSTLLLNESFF
ncbi:Protein canopy 3 [Bulinus truncatus]|nr:Protein canopy 3 [Bulinus truncatus]